MTTKRVAIIGIDCAVSPKDVAIARGWSEEERLIVDKIVGCTRKTPPLATIEDLLPSHRPLLFCLDAPLGWPARLGEVLAKHRAGESVRSEAHALFRRDTDITVKRVTGQQPLDVGADRIARTAEAALTLLDSLRERLHAEIPLAWNSESLPEISAIEVYPAATMRQIGLSARLYKKPESIAERRAILNGFSRLAQFTVDQNTIDTGHILDAVACVIAGSDFIANRCIPPADMRTAAREGWIWVRRRD